MPTRTNQTSTERPRAPSSRYDGKRIPPSCASRLLNGCRQLAGGRQLAASGAGENHQRVTAGPGFRNAWNERSQCGVLEPANPRARPADSGALATDEA